MTTLSDNLNIIQALDDLPNDEGGLTSDQLKAKFDEAANLIKTFINSTLIPEATAAIEAASHGISQGSGIGSDAIADNAVVNAKIANGAVTSEKITVSSIITSLIANLAVTTAKLAQYAVTTDKIADSAVTSAKIYNGAITNLKYGDNSITYDKLCSTSGAQAVVEAVIRDAAVTAAKLASSAVITEKIADGAVTAAKLGSVHIATTTTLGSGATTWTPTITGATASNMIFWSASNDTSYSLVQNHNIRLTGQGSNSLTFKADSAPSSNVSVNIFIVNV